MSEEKGCPPRQELRKFMRESRKSNPAVQSSLQGDKLYIDHKWADTLTHTAVPWLTAFCLLPGAMFGAISRLKLWSTPWFVSPDSVAIPPPSLPPQAEEGQDPRTSSRAVSPGRPLSAPPPPQEKDRRIHQLEETVRKLQEQLKA